MKNNNNVVDARTHTYKSVQQQITHEASILRSYFIGRHVVNIEQNWYNVLYFDKEFTLNISVTAWPQLAARLMTETYPSIAVTKRVPSLFQHCNHEAALNAGQVPWRNNTSQIL
jgi:hypothetical protein